MGRNSTPKIGEWDDGHLYEFRTSKGERATSLDGGDLIIFQVTKGPEPGIKTILATAWADGWPTVLASLWQSGFDKGVKKGAEDARAEIRRALGVE